MPEFVFTMHNVRKKLGEKLVLDDVTLSFFEGAKIGIVGPNGAGKSTMLKLMAGLIKADNGDAMLAKDKTVGILMQEPVLTEGKTVLENIYEGVAETKALLDRYPNPTESQVRRWLSGNLCRCTGYDKIVRAVMDAAASLRDADLVKEQQP